MEPEVFRSNRCPICSGPVKVCQTNHFLTIYDLEEDGAIDEASEKAGKCFDDDGALRLFCEKCGTLAYGYRDDSGAYFEGRLGVR
jgi:hypothetical protein